MENIRNRAVIAKYVSDQDMSATQEYTRSLTSSGGRINQQKDKHVREKPQKRTLKIHHGVHVDANCLGDCSFETSEQSDACERRRRKAVAAAPKRAPLQQKVRPLQGFAGRQGLCISPKCLLDEPKAESQAILPK